MNKYNLYHVSIVRKVALSSTGGVYLAPAAVDFDLQTRRFHNSYSQQPHAFYLLTVHRMKEMAGYLMLVLGGNASPTADDVSKALSSVGVEADSDNLNKLISELDGKDLGEILESGEALLAKFGSGGGGGGGGGMSSEYCIPCILFMSKLT